MTSRPLPHAASGSDKDLVTKAHPSYYTAPGDSGTDNILGVVLYDKVLSKILSFKNAKYTFYKGYMVLNNIFVFHGQGMFIN